MDEESWSAEPTGFGEGFFGCTDSSASNFNPDAWEDDGSCKYGNQNISDISRSVAAIQIDYNYQIIKTMNLELNLYGEFAGIWYPDKIYYLQI